MIDETTLAGTMSSKEKAIGWILLLPSYLYYVPTIINFIFKFYIDHINAQVDYTFLGVLLNLGVSLICTVMTVFALKDFLIENIKAFKEKLFENIVWSCSAGIAMEYGLAILSNLIVLLLLGTKGNDGSANQQLFNVYLSSGPILMFIQAVIFAPILEELLFRGIIFRTARKKGLVLGHIISSLTFGFLHVYSGLLQGDMTQWIHMIPYVAMGFAFSYAYEKRGNICVPMIIHMLNNFIAIMLSFMASKF